MQSINEGQGYGAPTPTPVDPPLIHAVIPQFDHPAPEEAAVRSIRCIAVVCVTGLVLAACSELPPTEPAADLPDAHLSMMLDDEFESTGQTLVVYNAQRLPNRYADVIATHGGSVVAAYDQIGVAVVDGLTPEAAAALQQRSEIRNISPDYLIPLELPEDVMTDALTGAGIANDNPETALFFARQWHLRAIGADQAWAAGFTGSGDVTVAILDTGIGYIHPDVAGLVDLSRSVSFVPSDDALVNLFFPGAHPIADLHWHGTHVAATVSSNAFAAAGVTSKTTLIGVKVCNVNGSCPTSGVLAGVMYAADQRADILNLSVGGLFLKSVNPGFVAVINRAYNYANQRGIVIVTSAGNATADLDRNIVPLPTNIPLAQRTPTHLPSLYALYCNSPHAVCVSATGPTSGGTVGPWLNVDNPASYSNFGRSAIDVAAPGGAGGGAVWAACSPFSLQIPVCQTGVFVLGASGTSMASPHAAGVAALIAANGARNPAQLRNRLHQTADDLGDPGTDPFYGRGRVNAARAVGLN